MLDTDNKATSDKSLSFKDRVQSLKLPEHTQTPGSPHAWIPWVLCALLSVSTGAFGYLAFNQKKSPTAAPGSLPTPTTATSSATAPPRRDDDIALEAKGYIVPISMIQVSPKVGGMVIALNIQEGTRVRKGAVLAELETTEYLAERDRVRAQAHAARARWEELWKYRAKEIKQAKADLEESRAQLDQLHQEFMRAVSLKEARALSPKEYDVASSDYLSRKFRVEHLQLALDLLKEGPRDQKIAAAKAELDQFEADLVKAQWRLDNCTVVAPVSGIILSKKTEMGNMVNPSAFSNGLSASICEMADLTRMEVDLAIAERDIGKVFIDQQCKIRAEAFPDRIYEGKVSRLMPMADRSKGAVPVRVIISIPAAEEGQFLRPEMGAIVTFLSRK